MNVLPRHTSKIVAAGAFCHNLRPRTAANSLRTRARRLPPHPIMRTLALLLVLALCSTPAAAQTILNRGGDLFFRARCDLPSVRITDEGRDSQARLSPDGRLIVFVREARRDSVNTAQGRVPASSIWIIRTDGGGIRELVRARSDTTPERALAVFQVPQFSPDSKRIYFLSSAWATSGAVHAVDIASGAQRYLVPGNSLEVAATGPYAGHLLVEQHRSFIARGSYDWVWLITPEGREVGPLTDSPDELQEFREAYVRGSPEVECT